MDAVLSGISIGAVGAAFIAAVASVLGLVISKENKVSDFRQAWIDALRAEITSYLSSINAIFDASDIKYESHEAKVAKLSQHYAALNTANFMISLRLNPEEEDAKKIMICMNEFKSILSKSALDSGDLRRVEREFLLSSKSLLKREWLRVKKGEKTFQFVKYFTMCIIGVIALLAIIITLMSYRSEILPPTEVALPEETHCESTAETDSE